MRFLHTSDWQLGITRYFLSEEAQARFTQDRIDAIRAIGRLAEVEKAEFVVVAGQGAIILKAIEPPSMNQFEELMADARRQARRAGLKRSDIAAAVTEARKGRRRHARGSAADQGRHPVPR